MLSGYDIRIFWKYKSIVLIADYMISFWELASTVGLADVQDAREKMMHAGGVCVPNAFTLFSRDLLCYKSTSLIQVFCDKNGASLHY